MLLLQGILSIETRHMKTAHGDISFLFNSIVNSPQEYSGILDIRHKNFVLFLRTGYYVNNVFWSYEVENNQSYIYSVSLKARSGLVLDNVTLELNCESCNRTVFLPVIDSPNLVFFNCIFKMQEMDFLSVPEVFVMKSTKMIVKLFYLQKSKFQVLRNNLIYSNNQIRSIGYEQIGILLDNSVKTHIYPCLQCTDAKNSLISDCSCPSTAEYFNGQCRESYTFTEPPVQSSSNYYYFLKCGAAINTNLLFSLAVNEQFAFNRTIHLLDNDNCGVNGVRIDGYINYTTTGTNQYYGITKTLTQSISSVNTSLEITHNGNGMASSSLLAYENAADIDICSIRITGSINSIGINMKELAALLLCELNENLVINHLGIFGALLNYSSNGVGFVVAKANTFNLSVYCAYIVPYTYPDMEEIDRLPIEASYIQIDPSFPCSSMGTPELSESVKMKYYLDEREFTTKEAELVLFTPGYYQGGLVGIAEGSLLEFSQLVVDMQITEINDVDAEQYSLGVLLGLSSSSLLIDSCYISASVESYSDNVGIIGKISNYQNKSVEVSVASELRLLGRNNVGIIGLMENGIYSLNFMANVTVDAVQAAGFIGGLKGGTINAYFVGNFSTNCSNYANNFIGELFSTSVTINSLNYTSTNYTEISGSMINLCLPEELEERPLIVASELVAFNQSEGISFYAIGCVRNSMIESKINTTVLDKASYTLLQESSCGPYNLEVEGYVNIAQESNYEVSVSGFVGILNAHLSFINTSLSIVVEPNPQINYFSLIAWQTQLLSQNLTSIRISGSLVGNSGTGNGETKYMGVLICYLQHEQVYIQNIGVFGVDVKFGGTSHAGVFAEFYDANLTAENVYCGSRYAQLLLPNQLQTEQFYYLTDSCANFFSPPLASSLNMKYVLVQQEEPIKRSQFAYSLYSNHNIGGFVGESNEPSFRFRNLLVDLDVSGSMTEQCVGLLVAKETGQLDVSSTYVSGSITGSVYYGGVIGQLSGDGTVEMAADIVVQGYNFIGTIGQAYNSHHTLRVYYRATITAQTCGGGLIGQVVRENSMKFDSIVGRTTFLDCGSSYFGLFIGYINGLALDTYAECTINKC